MIEIGEWVFRTACTEISALPKLFRINNFKLNINVSVLEIYEKEYINSLESVLKETRFNRKNIVLELAETSIMKETKKAARNIKRLADHGYLIAIDDFGTGYSSLNYLRLLPISIIKIDKSFIHDIPFDKDDESITKAIINLAKNLKIKIISEGIETRTQLELLKSYGCLMGQGFYFAKSMECEQLKIWMTNSLKLSNKYNPLTHVIDRRKNPPETGF